MASNQSSEAQLPRKRGGWIAFPFIAGNVFGLSLALNGATSNFIVYLIREFNINSVDAAQITNIINGCNSLASLAGAILSDAFFGCFPVVAVSSLASLLSMIILTLTAAIPALRHQNCDAGSASCSSPAAGKLAFLYGAMVLLSVGSGGTKFNLMTMGADQFDEERDQGVFFNWYFIVQFSSFLVGATVVVYVEDSISWGLGFGLCAAANGLGAVFFLLGERYYRRQRTKGSPFTAMARVVVAAIRKRKLALSTEASAYYHRPDDQIKSSAMASSSPAPTISFSFLNRAALISDGDTRLWRLCTVKEVEDNKTLIRVIPLWASGILLNICIAAQISLTVIQALTMDRSFGHHLIIPAGSFIVFNLVATPIILFLLDRAIFPTFHFLTGHNPTPLQRIGVGHVLNIAAMAASALVEQWRIEIVKRHNAASQKDWIAPMSAMWLVLPFTLSGAGIAFHFPGQVGLYYQEFPTSLKSTSAGMVGMLQAIGYFLSSSVVDVVRKTTSWLPDNMNQSRMDNVYWMFAVLATINFGYYVLCAKLYKYQSVVKQSPGDDSGVLR